MFDARPHLALQQRDEVISFDLAVADDCGQKAWADGLTGMDRDYRAAAVCVTKEVMAPLDPGDIEAGPSQGSDHLSPGNARGRRVTPR
jgi:hypothetical protein